MSALTNVVLIVVAVVMAVRVASSPTATPPPERSGATIPENWEAELSTGIAIGPADAPIKIVEFMDFQCPFCRSWSQQLDSVLAEYPGSVQVSFQHFPLTRIHTGALPAAVAAECADRQGHFLSFARAVFADQVFIGSRPWKQFAALAGVPDLAAFEVCVSLPADSFPRIKHGRELAEKTGVRGTPTVWFNGAVRRPTIEELRQLAAVAGR